MTVIMVSARLQVLGVEDLLERRSKATRPDELLEKLLNQLLKKLLDQLLANL